MGPLWIVDGGAGQVVRGIRGSRGGGGGGAGNVGRDRLGVCTNFKLQGLHCTPFYGL